MAGKPVHDAGPDVRAEGTHAPHVPDQEHPGRQPAVLAGHRQAHRGHHPGVADESGGPVHAAAPVAVDAGHSVPREVDQQERLAPDAGPTATGDLGPYGAQPAGVRTGTGREPRPDHVDDQFAAVVHRVRVQRAQVRRGHLVEQDMEAASVVDIVHIVYASRTAARCLSVRPPVATPLHHSSNGNPIGRYADRNVFIA